MKIFFDMDGTIADLYRDDNNWLFNLQNELPIFQDLLPLVNVEKFSNAIHALKKQGCHVGIITWLPMNTSLAYQCACIEEKSEWIDKHFGTDLFDSFHPLEYGKSKHEIEGFEKGAILFDDNKEVRKLWKENGGVAFNEKVIEKALLLLRAEID